ncbi:MAG: bifunctional 2-C-methyl-D-erythritol 4-phosphate cytidylyltransferase/2-C-methyl-D-erythritol 2,4-cyclodiphosphate synthase [Rickettsiales bacterium]
MLQIPRIYALIVAAGVGRRAGGAPKQYQPIDGKPMLRYSVEALAARPAIRGVQVVIHADHKAEYDAATAGLRLLPPIIGGAERTDSVRAGLDALAVHKPDYVLIHDAARPFLSQAMIGAIITTLAPEEGVLPALPVADTVRRFEGGVWHEVSRAALMRMQTPQAFPFARIRALVANAPRGETDEAALWLAAGHTLRYVEGDEELRKVTTAADIAWANSRVGSAHRTAIGMGYDVHVLMPAGDKQVIRLGGIDISNAHALHGHSDADVVLHAIVDALLGSIAAGDIGSFFPPTDARWKGANSAIFIEEARAQVAQRGGIISHLDITLIGEQPKVAPHRDAMRQSIANLLRLPLSHVSVKATTTEKLGFEGREEGIACHAIATVQLPAEAA